MRERERDTGRGLVVMDVCPTCEGIWLDRGELEKLASAERSYYGSMRRRDDDDDDDDFGGQRRGGLGGFFGNIFGGSDDD